MSEYNVAVSEDGVTVFDWPQAVSTDHENAHERLCRDISNLLTYFERKYPNSTDRIDAESDAVRIANSIAAGQFESVDAIP